MASNINAVNHDPTIDHNTGSKIGNAKQLIDLASDPNTGHIDTRQLASWVGEAASYDFNVANQAFSEIQNYLTANKPFAATHFNNEVVDSMANNRDTQSLPMSVTAWVAGNEVSKAGRNILRNNPILTVTWTSTENLNGESGFTSGLKELLDSKGIVVDKDIRSRPPEVVSTASAHRPSNGAAAQKAIVREYDISQAQVRTEVVEQTPITSERRPTGERHVDIVVQRPGKTPETNTRLDIESKLGRPGLDTETRMQVDKDAYRLEQNARLRNIGGGMDLTGKILKPVGIIIDAVQIGQAIKEDGGQFGENTQKTTAGIAGGMAGGVGGAWAGAAAGAAIGSAVPVIGTAIGGIVGGLLGAFGGSYLGESAGKSAYSALTH